MTQAHAIPIAAVERETGINKETLRIWERRYAFPLPLRNSAGKRTYSPEDVIRLKLIGLLIKQGHRPSKVIALEVGELKNKLSEPAKNELPRTSIDQVIAWLKKGETTLLKNWLLSQIAKEGLRPFLEKILTPLLVDIGLAWRADKLRIHEEHLFSETVQQTLRIIINHLPVTSPKPHIILTTPQGELHGLGLLIVESVLALEGIKITSLGINTPSADIVIAAEQLKADAVIISMTSNYKDETQRLTVLRQLRNELPQHIALLSGGSGTLGLPMIENVSVPQSFSDLITIVNTSLKN
jgi:MerR family transcriptional regulator, light-induced transcriptional regulator